MSPLVIAVPVMNAQEFLPRTLESLNLQGAHLRWWLQDSISQDNTLAIARHYARSCDTIVSEPDCGQADAINRAFAKMGGEIIGFLNGDDLLTPGTAERVVDYFRMHPHIDIIYGCVEWIDRAGNVTGRHSGRIQSLGEVLDIYSVWWQRRQWVQPEVFFRRRIFEKAGPFNSTLHLAFDFDFWVRCFRAGATVAHTPAITAQFRLHGGQKSAAAERAADEIRTVVKKHLADAPIPLGHRLAIRAALSYDLYQLGRTTPEGQKRPSFLKSLLLHPHWLLSPLARNRAQSSLAKFSPFRRRWSDT